MFGAIVGAGAGGASERGGGAPKLARGGLGPPPGNNLVQSVKPVPILMYHVISEPPSGARLPELYVDPKTFTQQMETLGSRATRA